MRGSSGTQPELHAATIRGPANRPPAILTRSDRSRRRCFRRTLAGANCLGRGSKILRSGLVRSPFGPAWIPFLALLVHSISSAGRCYAMSRRTSRAKVGNPGPGADWRTASRSDGKSVLQRRRNRVPQRLENVSRSDSGTAPSAEAGPRHAVRGRHYPSSSTCSGSITSTRQGPSTCQRFRPVACRDTASVPLARRAHRPSRVHRRFMSAGASGQSLQWSDWASRAGDTQL